MLKPILGREELVVKEEFQKRYRQLLGSEYDKFMDYSTSYIRRSMRVNTLKKEKKQLLELLKEWQLSQVPWCPDGYWIIGNRLDIGNLPEHIMGYFYVQEAASMIPPEVLQPKSGEIVLDMCAAPGSKTTQMAAMMQNQGVIIANDVNGDRIKALGLNLNRNGVSNTIITHNEGKAIKKIEFDKVLLDAPCSATGTIRRNFKVAAQYNYTTVERLAAIQKGLIRHCFKLLKPEGTMVYSTCSMEPLEDESIIDYLLQTEPEAKIQKIELDIKRSVPITEFDGQNFNDEVKKCLRIWPQDNDTEGFFVTKITKQ